jgi:hypothetical protein
MATGGVFKLITNDGKADRMLMATQMLRNRLNSVRAKRRADPSLKDETPTLLDIERTHVLFTNAHFKPFVAIGYEYNKVNTGAGSVQLGSEVQFSIPQFGDFFHDMVLYVKLSAPTLTRVPGTVPDTTPIEHTARWCDYPGERLLQEVAFEVNGNPLDKYTADSAVMRRNIRIQPNKETGYKRCVGQQIPRDAWFTPTPGATDAVADLAQMHLTVTDGPQTPKTTLDGLSMLIPLAFWCNDDPRLAVPSVAIPFGQRFIKMKLATAEQMVGEVDVRGSADSSTVSTPTIETMALYINNIFVNPEIHKIFIQRIGFTLIRVHREQKITVTSAEDEILLQNLKWPIETMFVGLRPTSQKTSLAHWHKFTSISDETLDVPQILSSAGSLTYDNSGGAGTTANEPVDVADSGASVDAYSSAKTVDRLTISAHGIALYNDLIADFFSDYTPLAYGGSNIRTPEDTGVLMIPFNLYPGTYQPSGHVNVSRAREFYIKYSSSVISSGTPGELVIIASALNFLLISDGSAVLRYST